MKQSEVFDLIKEFAGQQNIVAVPVAFIRYTGSIEAAVLLSQVIYWSGKTEDGWFYKSHKDWEEEIALGKYEVRKATSLLIKMGVLETRLRKANGAPTLHYRLKDSEFSQSIVHFLNNRKFTDCTNQDSAKSEQSINKRLPKTTNSKETKSSSDCEIPPPFRGPEFTQALSEFESHRVELRKPLKPTGRRRLYSDLAAWGERRAIEALRQAVRSGYQGVFEPKGNEPSHPNAYVKGRNYV